jgi:hypothetical protein
MTVKAINHIEQNRPVHLALRDVYYEQAVGILSAQRQDPMHGVEIPDYETILFMLRTARQHAYFSIRADGKNEKDEQFGRFINLLAGNVKAVLSMLNLKHTVEDAEGFFLSFLEVNYASVALQAEEYERRVRDIVRSIHNTLDLASGAYEELKQANLEAFSGEERERYEKAVAHQQGLIKKMPEAPRYEKRTGLFA